MKKYGKRWSQPRERYESKCSARPIPTSMLNSRKRGLKIFVDSSVFFAAVLSPSGGSFRIFLEARERGIVLCVTLYVVSEVGDGLQKKYPEKIKDFRSFFLHFPIQIVQNPPNQATKKFSNLLPAEDAPILAGAVATRATHLLTLDKKHFLGPLKNIKLPVQVLTPGDFIQNYFV